jgi:murein L,D-transpeptidase YcbB/YkuD
LKNYHYFFSAILLISFLYEPYRKDNQIEIYDIPVIREILRNRIETAGNLPNLFIWGDRIYASIALPKFYEDRQFLPAWINPISISENSNVLINIIEQTENEGLNPADYHLFKIKRLISDIRQQSYKQDSTLASKIVDLDLLLTDAYLILASHYIGGRINPVTVDPEWHAQRKEVDIAKLLKWAINENIIEKTLQNLLPPQRQYKILKKALIACKNYLLDKDKLKLSKFLQIEINDSTVYRKIVQLEVNMERWRWIPQDLGEKYVIVNIANFELDVIQN